MDLQAELVCNESACGSGSEKLMLLKFLPVLRHPVQQIVLPVVVRDQSDALFRVHVDGVCLYRGVNHKIQSLSCGLCQRKVHFPGSALPVYPRILIQDMNLRGTLIGFNHRSSSVNSELTENIRQKL